MAEGDTYRERERERGMEGASQGTRSQTNSIILFHTHTQALLRQTNDTNEINGDVFNHKHPLVSISVILTSPLTHTHTLSYTTHRLRERVRQEKIETDK